MPVPSGESVGLMGDPVQGIVALATGEVSSRKGSVGLWLLCELAALKQWYMGLWCDGVKVGMVEMIRFGTRTQAHSPCSSSGKQRG